MADTDEVVELILRTYDTITVVGASTTASKAAHSVPAHMQQHGWRIIPVNLDIAERAGRFLASARAAGFEPDTEDAWIAATADVRKAASRKPNQDSRNR